MNTFPPEPPIRPDFDWNDIDTVLLDLDGTLLDKYFDDYFWETFVPKNYAHKHGLSESEAEQRLLDRYRAVQSTMQWSDLGYWSKQLELDIYQLKCELDHLIEVHPYVVDFLHFIRSLGKRVCLVTAAHALSLELKLQRTSIAPLFDRLICIEEVGLAKEDPSFWPKLQRILDFSPERTLLADDTAKVLESARLHGLAQLIFVARPSSRAPVVFSERFPSIVYFNELIFSARRNQRHR